MKERTMSGLFIANQIWRLFHKTRLIELLCRKPSFEKYSQNKYVQNEISFAIKINTNMKIDEIILHRSGQNSFFFTCWLINRFVKLKWNSRFLQINFILDFCRTKMLVTWKNCQKFQFLIEKLFYHYSNV